MAVTMLQIPHAMGGFGLTPNVLAQSTDKATMEARFLGFVGSLPLDDQKIWLPNQSAQEPQTWLAPNLLHLKEVYEVLLNKHNCKEQESYVVQDQPLPPSDTLLLPPLSSLYKVHMRNQQMPQVGDSRPVMPPSQHVLSKQVMKNWDFWEKKTPHPDPMSIQPYHCRAYPRVAFCTDAKSQYHCNQSRH
jgi:hypothetical protein